MNATIESGLQFAEAIFRAAQDALHPVTPPTATPVFANLILADLHGLAHDLKHPVVAQSWATMLILSAVKDVFEAGKTLRICNVASTMQTIYQCSGKADVVAMSHTLYVVRRAYPQTLLFSASEENNGD